MRRKEGLDVKSILDKEQPVQSCGESKYCCVRLLKASVSETQKAGGTVINKD